MTTPANPRDWTEPPEWWRKWRPLRWIAALLVVLVLYRACGTGDSERPAPAAPPAPAVEPTAPPPAEPVESAPAAPVAPLPASPAVPLPKPVNNPPAPAAVPAPAPAATPAAAPAPAPLVESEPVFEEESLPPVTYRAYLQSPADPVTLFDGMKSYSGVDEIFTRLKRNEMEPQLQSFHTRVPVGVPPRELDVLRMSPYRHLGVEGSLELQFFNDRLYQAEFEPGDAEAYQRALRRALPALERRRTGRSELRQGNLRIASSLDLAVSDVGKALGTRPFVIWQDIRLVQQRDAWDREFGPKKAAP
jgi:hypothetical protein